jgi:hypothetical protein
MTRTTIEEMAEISGSWIEASPTRIKEPIKSYSPLKGTTPCLAKTMDYELFLELKLQIRTNIALPLRRSRKVEECLSKTENRLNSSIHSSPPV